MEAESPDFASENYGDPWDYANAEDQNTDLSNSPSISVSGGKLIIDIRPGTTFQPVASIDGSLPYGRDGAASPITPTRYKHLSFRMDQPARGIGAIYWFTCRSLAATCGGGLTFPLVPGDHVYDIALDGTSILAAKQPWTKANVTGLMIQPVVLPDGAATVRASMDWMRLFSPERPHASLPPGTYSDVSIEAIPIPVIDSPTPLEGQDIATAQRGSPWLLTSAASANAAGVRVTNATVSGYGSRGMTATNSAPVRNDPQVSFAVAPFNASKYHHMSFEMTYDGAFDLNDAEGGGKMARLIWGVQSTTTPQVSDDILTWSKGNGREVYLDLAAGSVTDPESGGPRVGWAGQTVTSVRFDPNEDPGAATWNLKSLALRADPEARQSTTVRFHDNAWVSGTTADVKVGTGASGTPYETIASGVPVSQGANSVLFDLGSRPQGSYRVQVILRHPIGGGALAVSKTAVTMLRDASRDPRGSVDQISRAPGGALVRGWVHDPDTNQPMSVRVTDGRGGPVVATSTSGQPRADVQRAVPGAPLGTGYEQSVPLSSGRHSVCATAVNVGSGSDIELGCRDVDVDPRPAGSLDSVTRIPGGLRAEGWAIDPDTSASIPVHFYVGAKGVQATADRSRPDVARSWPSYGDGHGYRSDMTRAAGDYQACAYGIDTSGGSNTLLGCRSVTVDPRPFGAFDTVTRSGGSVTVRGWAIDPDTANSIDVHVYVDGRGATSTTASMDRSDIARVYPDWGGRHGYQATVTAAPGSTVCVYAIDDAGGENPTMACKRV
ncbi:hypothetical protein ACPEEZ_06640 [Frigoribacterium sp. 2-23]|uniref:hypothetical protein n=1 Tax=Frigoribacterium sp. 2-23 TaxID=3415006 RepID=UPI003C6FB5D8